jgi:hypothetical protein
MGQKIEVAAESHGDIAVFVTDRTITGQDGDAFSRTGPFEGFGGTVAERLLTSDPAIEHVFVQFNVVSVRRNGGWDDGALERASEQIGDLFLVY